MLSCWSYYQMWMSWRCCWSDIFQGELNIKVFSLLCQYFVIYLILDKRLHSKVQQFVLILHFHFPKLRWVSRVGFACEINLLFNGAESDVRLFPLQFLLILYSIVFFTTNAQRNISYLFFEDICYENTSSFCN